MKALNLRINTGSDEQNKNRKIENDRLEQKYANVKKE